jgi:hypothetical protein
VPDRKSFPKRSLIVIGATALGFFAGVLIVLLQASFLTMGRDPQTSAKLSFIRSSMSMKRAAPSPLRPSGKL